MKGTRPLDNDEIRRVSAAFTGTYEIRNRGLFMLGVSTGGRISELLSLRVGDVYQNDRPVTDLLFDKSIVKGKVTSRAVPVNVDGRNAIAELVDWHRDRYGDIDANRPLFPSRNKNGTLALNRQTAHDLLKEAFMAAGLNGKLATHSLPSRSFPSFAIFIFPCYTLLTSSTGTTRIGALQRRVLTPHASYRNVSKDNNRNKEKIIV